MVNRCSVTRWCAILVLGLAGTLHAQREDRTRRPDDRYNPDPNDRYYNPSDRNPPNRNYNDRQNYNPNDRQNYNPNDRNYNPNDRNHNPNDRNYNPPNDRNYNPNDRNYNPYDRATNNRNYNPQQPDRNQDRNQAGGYGDFRQYAPGERGRPNSRAVGDLRCEDAVTSDLELTLSVNLDNGRVVEGRYVYLCDGPEVPEHSRPGRGRTVTAFYRNVSVFLGIPYAEPPKGDLRFKPPRVSEAWKVVRADQYRPACPQGVQFFGEHMGADGVDEDCLYLNIFTPNAKRDVMPKYATLVYIHGGDWDHGHANGFPAHMLAASQEVVVVTFNYRLGAFGFLATGDGASPGNYGVLDQSMAIHWVYDNIQFFNGDPNTIVLFGPGAGAASAGLHAFSPLTKDVVRRVIAQSGSALADWGAILDPSFMHNASRLFGEALGCTRHSSYDLVDCLRQRSVAEIINVHKKPEVGWLLWGPVLDNVTASPGNRFLPFSPEELIERADRLPDGFAYLAGVTRDEGAAMILSDDEMRRNRYRVTKDIFHHKIREYMHMYNYTLNADAIYNAIAFMYTDWSGPDNDTLLRQGYIDMLSDSYYKAPNDKIIKKLLGKNIKTYMYVLNYTIEGKPPILYTDNWIPHDTEYYLVTGGPFMSPAFYPRSKRMDSFHWTDADKNMSIFFMQSWANFAKYGNPTPKSLFNTILWEPMRLDLLQYLSINTTNLTSIMLSDYRQKQSQFWNHYLPSLIGREPVTWPPDYEPWEQREKRVYSAALWSIVAVAGILFILTFVFCCLYCSAKSAHLVEDDGVPETSANHEFLLQGSRDFGRKHDPEMVIMNERADKNTRV